MLSSWKKFLCLALLAMAVAKAEEVDGPFAKLRAKYDELSPKGTFKHNKDEWFTKRQALCLTI